METTVNYYEQLEALKAQKNALYEQFRNNYGKGKEDGILAKIRKIEAEITELNKLRKVSELNAKFDRLRSMAIELFNCELPSDDITCSDGSLHKTKVKKYPKLAALQYVTGKWDAEANILKSVRYNGEEFTLYKCDYVDGKWVYTEFDNLADYLRANHIPATSITLAEFEHAASVLAEAEKTLNAAIEQYSKKVNDIRNSTSNMWGLAAQSNTHTYKYSLNF